MTLQENKLWPVSNEFTIRALVVGPSSLSATQPCRLNERSLQLTRTLFPNFSSNCRTSGSMPEKSSFCGIIYKKKRFHQANDIYTISAEVNEAIISTQKWFYKASITCVSGSSMKSFRRASLLSLDSISLAVWKKTKQKGLPRSQFMWGHVWPLGGTVTY